MKAAEKVAAQLIKIPRRFTELGNISMYSLLKETGYFRIYSQVSADHIREELNRHPEYIDDWLIYSENKRCGGWYFMQDEQGDFVLGYVDGETDNDGQLKYANRTDACAAFIKREIENIRCKT